MEPAAEVIHGAEYRFLLMTALIRNFYKDIMQRLRTHEFGLRATS